jgi:hypothetical protein
MDCEVLLQLSITDRLGSIYYASFSFDTQVASSCINFFDKVMFLLPKTPRMDIDILIISLLCIKDA